MSKFTNKIPKFLKSKWVLGAIGLVILVIGTYFVFFHKTIKYQFITVNQGSITESVSLTGNTTPSQSVSLAFGSSGIISNIYSSLGKQVQKGQVLAELNMKDLMAQLHNAQAGLTIAKQNANTTESNLVNITAEQDAIVASARQSLYGNFVAALSGNVSTSNVAPTISGSYTGTVDGSYIVQVYSSNSSNGGSLSYSGLESGTASLSTNTAVPLGTHGLFISFPTSAPIGTYVNTTWTVNVPNTSWNGYASALKNYQTALQTRDKVIATAQANIGTTDSSVVQAQIEQAQASVESVQAKIQNSQIIAPITGTITQFDAKVGQLASPSTPLVSIISNNNYEIDAGVSETDVGKILVGNKATITLDAFPNETFTGSVFYIAPAESNVQGVVNYQTKISFDKLDPRLKSGLTANINIQTRHKDNILILPQYAILQNDQGTFVETLENNKVKQNPVTLGISDEKGNVEVISGVTKGEQVLNIGLKVK
ncbi:MAG: efflux RND transporter periplasmic adaptor subunit [Patescibacteria group bacterium]|nr:efflux RND transporter periplasmic adaptor subunit [Patescibacteria group bacterium]